MDDELRQRLIQLNRNFYRLTWREFDDSRSRPWKGWSKVLDLVGDSLDDDARILDVGCGNGRFAAYLAARGVTARYLGLDASHPLLARARRRRLAGTSFACADLLAAGPRSASFRLVTAFGLLHHVPGQESRRRLLADLAQRVRDGGSLVVTLWQPDAGRKARAQPVRGAEPGDVLLPWGVAGAARYCHFFADREIDLLAADLEAGIGPPVSFRADGRGGENLYLVAPSIQRPERRTGGKEPPSVG